MISNKNDNVNTECAVIADVLPSYAEGIASEATSAIVRDHLAECPTCRQRLAELQSGGEEKNAEIRSAEKAYLRMIKRRQAMPYILSAAAVLVALLLCWAFVPGILGDDRLTETQIESVMKQYVSGEEKEYGEYLPDEHFAACHIYGVDRDGDKGVVYAAVDEREYVLLGGKAYEVSGGIESCALHVKFEGDRIKLKSVKHPSDGAMLMPSLRQMYPLRYYIRMKFSEMGRGGAFDTGDFFAEKVRKLWTAEVSEDLLDIDTETGKYTVSEVKDAVGENGEITLDSKVVDSGVLKKK